MKYSVLPLALCLVLGCSTSEESGSGEAPTTTGAAPASTAGAPASSAGEESSLEPGIAATVDGREILESDVLARVDLVIGAQIPIAALPPEQLDSIRQNVRPQVLEELIAETLLEAEAERVGFEVEEDVYAAEFERTLETYLASQNMTREELAERVTAETGQPFDAFVEERSSDPNYRRMTRHTLLIRELYPDQTAVSDAEVAERYEAQVDQLTTDAQVRASHVLISTEAEMSDEDRASARQQADEIAEAARAEDSDFAALAREHSSCPSSAQGGDLGFFPREGKMVEPFAAAAFELEVGQTSGVVETQFGYHVIKVTEKQEANRPELDQVAGMLRDSIQLEKVAEQRAAKLEELQAAAEIVRS